MFDLEKNLKKLLEENKEKIQWNQFEEKFIEFTPKVIKRAPNDTYFHNKKRLKRHLRRLAIVVVLFVVALIYLI